VKNGTILHPQDIRALKTFGEDYPEAERVLVYRGSERLKREGISIEPCEGFLMGMK
jgi:hypothetical protein